MTHPLLSEIQSYLIGTGTNETAFGVKALNNPSFLHEMRCGRYPRQATVNKVREFMSINPKGVHKLKNRVAQHAGFKSHNPHFNRAQERIDTTHLIRVDRTPCYNCGVRGDVGCEHFPLEVSA